MRYLITGAAGFMGKALVERLLSDGHEVHALIFNRRLPGDWPVEVYEGDVRNISLIVKAMDGCDSVIHLAYPQGRSTDPRWILDIAVQGSSSVLNACEITGTRELMLVSSPLAYGVPDQVPTPETVPLTVPDPLNPYYAYGGGKLISELMAVAWAQSGVLDRLIISRPFNIYGPDAGYEHVIPQLATRICKSTSDGVLSLPIQGSDQDTRAFCHISDYVNATMILLEKAEKPISIYNIGNPEEVTMEKLVHLIGKHYRQEVRLVPSSGTPSRRCPDISKLQDLGYQPQIPLAQGIGPVLDWYQDHG